MTYEILCYHFPCLGTCILDLSFNNFEPIRVIRLNPCILINFCTMKTVVVPVDFSPVSENAIHYALNMANHIQAEVLLFHVYQIPVTMSDVPVNQVTNEELHNDAVEQIEELKKSILHIRIGNVPVETEVRRGNIVDELESLCRKVKPFAIIMGTKGSSEVERIIFGSTALTVIRDFTWPVIIVPPGTLYKPIGKIGFACDFRQVLDTTPTPNIIEMVKTFNAELHVLNVDHGKHRKDEERESEILHRLLQGLNPQYHTIQNENVEDGINEFAEKHNLDLLITIPRKQRLLDTLFRRSHTRKLVFESHVPIMCIHER